MTMQQRDPCTAPLTTRTPPAIGHNSQHTGEPSEPFGLRAAWLHFANMRELRRLAQLHGRINRRKQSLDELVTECQRIMNRCIRRMRRQQGKN